MHERSLVPLRCRILFIPDYQNDIAYSSTGEPGGLVLKRVKEDFGILRGIPKIQPWLVPQQACAPSLFALEDSGALLAAPVSLIRVMRDIWISHADLNRWRYCNTLAGKRRCQDKEQQQSKWNCA